MASNNFQGGRSRATGRHYTKFSTTHSGRICMNTLVGTAELWTC